MNLPRSALAATATALLFALTPVLVASPVIPLLPADTTPPTAPKALKVNSIASYTVSLSWNASTDNSGSLSYVIQASNGYTMTVPQSSTSATFVGALYPKSKYSFFVYAVDAAGNRSANSNTVKPAALPADTTVPSVPSVTVTGTGAHHATFAWLSIDNDPYLSYFLYVNGVQVGHSTTATGGTFYLPHVNTAYTVSVKARDHGPNFSALSVPVTFSTKPIDTSDTQPPTAPTAFDLWQNGDLELFFSWTQSTDNVDPPQAIRYEIYINGELAEIAIGTGAISGYGEPGFNVISIIAIDSAGNESAPVTITTYI
jgi:chitodextrinase